ncbi:MAG: MurR/RpiR family transcriptional regulator, partial [Hyphomicrobiaceae bacterium]
PRKLAIAARFAVDHPDRIALDSMRTAAAQCGVTSPTMLRLARVVGFDSYDDFRGEFQRGFVGQGFGSRAHALQDVGSDDKSLPLVPRLAEAALQNLSQTIHNLDAALIDTFAKTVRRAGRLFIVGSGSMHWLAALMETTGAMALSGIQVDHSSNPTAVEFLASVDEKDAVLILSIAPYANRTIEAAQFAQAAGATVFGITDRRSSPIVRHCDHAFFVATESPHYYPSLVSVVLLIEVLLASAVSGARSFQRIEAVERLRIKSGAYQT